MGTLPACPSASRAATRPDALDLQMAGGRQRVIGLRDGPKLIAVALLTHDSRKGWINRLAVEPAYRRQGLASRLVAEAERWFTEECAAGDLGRARLKGKTQLRRRYSTRWGTGGGMRCTSASGRGRGHKGGIVTEPEKYNYDVFISYSHADKAWVRGAAAAAGGRGAEGLH